MGDEVPVGTLVAELTKLQDQGVVLTTRSLQVWGGRKGGGEQQGSISVLLIISIIINIINIISTDQIFILNCIPYCYNINTIR